MVKNAYVLINCEVGYEKPIIKELKQLDSVLDVTSTFGPYDIIAKIEKEKIKTLPEIVEQIRQISHITSTTTLPDADENIQPEKNGDELIPDVIPKEKKPLQPPSEIDEEEDDEDEQYDNNKS